MRAIREEECYPVCPLKGKQLEIARVTIPVEGCGYECDSVIGFGDPQILKMVLVPYGTKLKILGGTDVLPVGSVVEVMEGVAVTGDGIKVPCLGVEPRPKVELVYPSGQIPGPSLANDWLLKLRGAKVEVL